MTSKSATTDPNNEENSPQESAPNPSPGGAVKRMLLVVPVVILAFCLLFATGCFLVQRKLMYFPTPYDPIYERLLAPYGTQISFETTEGTQNVFYLPPTDSDGDVPEGVWVLFGGNASLALDWLDLVDSLPREKTAFVLVDYPGYGVSDGKPTRAGIKELIQRIVPEVSKSVGLSENDLTANINTLGHSLGAAAAMEFAAAYPVQRVVLLAPFTSVPDMAALMLTPLVSPLALDRFDNKDRIAEVARRSDPPAIAILHGDQDQVIPFRMGKELSEIAPDITVFTRLNGIDHNYITSPSVALDEILEFMNLPQGQEEEVGSP